MAKDESKDEVIQDTPELMEKTDADKGMSSLVRTLPTFTVTVADESGEETTKEYQLRPLGLNDAVKALRVISAASMAITRMASQGGNPLGDANSIAFTLMASIPYAERDFKELVAGVITYKDARGKVQPVTVGNLEDHKMFPLDSLVDVVEAIGNHPDLAAFVKNARRLSESNLMIQIRESVRQGQTETPKN